MRMFFIRCHSCIHRLVPDPGELLKIWAKIKLMLLSISFKVSMNELLPNGEALIHLFGVMVIDKFIVDDPADCINCLPVAIIGASASIQMHNDSIPEELH